MDSLIGLKGKDFVLVAADSYAGYSLFRLKDNEDKIMEVDANKLFGMAGPPGERMVFGEFIRKNIHLHRLRTGIPLNTKAAASFTRGEMAYMLRNAPVSVELLVAGCDNDGPQLYWMDYLASMIAVEKGAHGYAAYFAGGVLDRHYKPNMELKEAKEVIMMCMQELKKRFVLSQFNFTLKVVDKNGIRCEDVSI